MTAVFTVIMVLEAASLMLLWVVAHAFRKMRGRHAQLFSAIEGSDQHRNTEVTSRVIFWIYVVSTFALTIVTLSLFIFQPHII